jgi:hypothetical protein
VVVPIGRMRTPPQKKKATRYYTFNIKSSAGLKAFARHQKVPAHNRAQRRRRGERWVVSRFLMAANHRRRLHFPVRIRHALVNQAPDFIVTVRGGVHEGYEVTQATTRKYQVKLERNEKRRKPEAAIQFGDLAGSPGYLAETYWCRRILHAIRGKLSKLNKGHYEKAARQHLLIYDDMEAFGVDHREALRRLKRPLATALSACACTFDSISIVTTQNTLLLDVSNVASIITIPLL